MNKFICTAELGRDPEVYEAKNGDYITKLLLHVENEKAGDDYFEAAMVGATGKYISQHLQKGDKVLVEGALHNRYWQNKNGETRQKTEVKVGKIEFLKWGEKDVKVEKERDTGNPELDERELC